MNSTFQFYGLPTSKVKFLGGRRVLLTSIRIGLFSTQHTFYLCTSHPIPYFSLSPASSFADFSSNPFTFFVLYFCFSRIYSSFNSQAEAYTAVAVHMRAKISSLLYKYRLCISQYRLCISILAAYAFLIEQISQIQKVEIHRFITLKRTQK